MSVLWKINLLIMFVLWKINLLLIMSVFWKINLVLIMFVVCNTTVFYATFVKNISILKKSINIIDPHLHFYYEDVLLREK